MPDPSLRDIQRWIKAGIRSGPGGPAGVPLAAMLNPQRGVAGVERLQVYAGGYLARTHEALSEVYEAVRHILGNTTFSTMAHEYAARYPSHDYNLSLRGRQLPDFLDGHRLSQSLPFLPDLARLEWHIVQSVHAAQDPPINPARLSAMSLDQWGQTTLRFQPSVGLMVSAWPILDIWVARTGPRSNVDIDLVNRPQRVLIFRHELEVRCELLEPQQASLLEGLLAGEPLGIVCGRLAQADKTLPIQQWFTSWIQAGLVAACEART